ncbi:MAG: histidine phosphatase family protein [Bacilli bacterium]|nr:histidine phosphatase family protein [Bacilli bacterium]
MQTTVYLMRHSKPNRTILNYENNHLLKNEITPLTVEGENRARKLADLPFFQNIDVIYSSHYTRAIATVKYLAEKLGKPINIEEAFCERIRKAEEETITPPNFELRQFKDHSFKLKGGESLNEVVKRYNEALNKVLNENEGKNIVIASHSAAMLMMLTKWCDYDTDKLEFSYKGKKVLDGKIDAPEIFKLTFENNNLIDIGNLRLDGIYKL